MNICKSTKNNALIIAFLTFTLASVWCTSTSSSSDSSSSSSTQDNQSFFQKYKTYILIGGAIAVAGGAYYYFKVYKPAQEGNAATPAAGGQQLPMQNQPANEQQW
eukprot:GAHX01000197.1.p1 GENE.GAHX01000197.1~~GAHX01000197.1.p1  ORF type:complete len:119 (+),score=20.37 GAHX01000197.1:44-358(+)